MPEYRGDGGHHQIGGGDRHGNEPPEFILGLQSASPFQSTGRGTVLTAENTVEAMRISNLGRYCDLMSRGPLARSVLPYFIQIQGIISRINFIDTTPTPCRSRPLKRMDRPKELP